MQCPYLDLLDPLPNNVDAYQLAISAAAGELLVGAQLPHGFRIVEAQAGGVLSRSPGHCGIGSVQIEAVDQNGDRADLWREMPYAVRRGDDQAWVVSFPETEMPVTQFCAENGFELTGGAETSSAKPPLATFSDVLHEALARRE